MASMPAITIVPDDLSGEPTRLLIARHLRGMHDNTPAESVHALDIGKLKDPSVTFWSAWVGENIAGCGALKRMDAYRGEIKSMRVHDAYLGQGIGRAILDHIIAEARTRGLQSLWLETGSSAPFHPAIRLYEKAGFTRCGPFDGYTEDPFSVFMTLTL
jgi:putative acetyltransferase